MSLGSLEVTTDATAAAVTAAAGCRAREVLERIGDKWSLYVVHLLGSGIKRFSELRREIDGITPRMLTVTVRSLERDGLVSRTVYPVVPPRVEYALTPTGATLLQAVTSLLEWADAHLADIDAARAHYDRVQLTGAEPLGQPVPSLPASTTDGVGKKVEGSLHFR